MDIQAPKIKVNTLLQTLSYLMSVMLSMCMLAATVFYKK